MRSWHRSSASWPGSCARTSRKNCRCCSGMCRRISSDASPASRFTGAAGPPAPRWRTSRSTWGTNAPISCRATRASSSCAVSMRCARVSIAWLRASSCSAHGAAHRDGSRLPVKLRVLLRLIEIQRVLLRHRLDDYVRATHLYRPLRFLFFLSPGVWSERLRVVSRAERLRLALEELGPIFVKFGQAVSTRRDLLPADIADELAKLQDRVPPFPGDVAKAMIERAYGKPIGEVFEHFDERPLAAASIAQVHVARLKTGREVIVKVLRPGMREVIQQDLEVLYALAGLAERFSRDGRRLRPLEVVKEYEKTVLDELDLMREAANAAQLKR